MANDFFNHSLNRVPAGTRARADHINNVADEIATGLDKLPTEEEIKQGKLNYAADSGVADAYVVTLTYTPTLSAGLAVAFQAANSNTGASTINVNALGAKSILHSSGGALVAGDIVAGQIMELRYDGTAFRIMARDTSAAGIKTLYESNADTNAFTDAEQTKLSGIETGATADQTAAEILTAIKTVDGSGSGLDADTLDGVDSTGFAAVSHDHAFTTSTGLTNADDLDLLTDVGTYHWNALAPANSPSGVVYKIMHMYSDGAQLQQIVHGGTSGGAALYMRRKDAGTWQAWESFSKSTHTHALNNLSDVNAGAPSDNQVLAWDTATSRWIAENVSALPVGDADTLDGLDSTAFALSAHSHAFSSITSKPTTLSGYGITDGINDSGNGQSITLSTATGTFDFSNASGTMDVMSASSAGVASFSAQSAGGSSAAKFIGEFGGGGDGYELSGNNNGTSGTFRLSLTGGSVSKANVFEAITDSTNSLTDINIGQTSGFHMIGLDLSIDGLGFYGQTPVAKPTITGSKGGNAALASLLTALADLGLITDSTT